MKSNMIPAFAAALALAACGDQGDGNSSVDMAADNAAMEEAVMGNPDNGMNTAMPAASNGREYAATASASDLFEIESARLAMEKSRNDGVKQLARMILADHQKSTEDLKSAARQAEPAIAFGAPQLDLEQQGNMQALRSSNGAQFDQTYLQQQVAAHQKALTMVESYARTGDVPPLKQHASSVSGPIRRHLDQARQLQTQPPQ